MKCRLSLPKTNYHLRKDNLLEQKFVYEPKVKAVSSFLFFNKGGVAQKLIHQLKYKGFPQLGVDLGKWYAQDLKAARWPIDVIIPVPLHHVKLKKRGYNQSDQIALGMADVLEVPFNNSCVVRTKSTTSQTRKSKVQRWQNIDAVYQVVDKDELINKNLLVVDDVLTTGATIGEMVAELAKYPVRGIYISTIAAGK